MYRTTTLIIVAGMAAIVGASRVAAAPTIETPSTSQVHDASALGHAAPAATQQPVCEGEPLAYDPQAASALAARAAQEGDAARGLEVFQNPKYACLSCHAVGGQGSSIGPALTAISRTANPEQMAESILWPNREVKPAYEAWLFATADGRTHQGYKRLDDTESITLFDITAQRELKLPKSEIEESRPLGSVMPANLSASMSAAERRDLLRFLIELGHNEQLVDAVAHPHEAAAFPYTRQPINEEAWPHWQHHVNRYRWYDYYAKEAAHFCDQPSMLRMLPAFPGLEGGKFGHWGTQGREGWDDARWKNADLGTLLGGVFADDKNLVVPKAVCVRLGDEGELATCFDPLTLTYRALWQGGFIDISHVRHGFEDGLHAAGEFLDPPAGEAPTQPFIYRGFYRYGKRVAFAYRIGDIEYLDAPWVEDGRFVRAVAPADDHPLKAALHGGPAQWPQEIKTHGELGNQRPYAIDTIPLPTDSPWKLPLFCGDHAFVADGVAMICTMDGDVWRASGIDKTLRHINWRRFASGLHHALGMTVHDGAVYVLGRDQITRLHDLNGDGEADFYECVSNAYETSSSGHDYICGLARDDQGRFYTASTNQGLIRISADGRHVDVVAEGVRNCDGIQLAPDGSITAPGSEGEWAPASQIYLIKPELLAANHSPYFGWGGPRGDEVPDLPLAYVPRGLDHSSGAQTTIPDSRWGPLEGRMIHLSYGGASHFLLLRDEVNGQQQGAVVPLPGEFSSGVHRGGFNPFDGQLYVSGMSGWATYAMDDRCFQRVRYTGDRVQLPASFHVHENGVLISFTSPIDQQQAQRLTSQFAQAWNYRYSVAYGSPEYSTRHPGVVGHDRLRIAGVHVVDSQTIFVEIPDIQPVNILHLALAVGDDEPQQLFITVHALDRPYTGLPDFKPASKVIAAHPLLTDLAALRTAEPNRWREPMASAKTLNIAAGSNLTFSPNRLTAAPGEAVCVKFRNPDAVPHNWVLIKPNTLRAVGDLANKLIAAPDAALRQYVPQTDDVLAYTDIVGAGQSFTIYVRAPNEPGSYPFLCTFPGHWMVMNGELRVERADYAKSVTNDASESNQRSAIDE